MRQRCFVGRLPGERGVRHRVTCLRCQAAHARARGIARELRAMGDDVVPAPADLIPAVMAAIGPQDTRSDEGAPSAHRGAWRLPGAALAAVTGILVATGVVKWRSRAVT